MLGLSREDGRPSVFATTLKSVVMIGALAYLSAGWLASTARDAQTMTRLSDNVSRNAADPLTTGSLAGRASGTKVDPCGPVRR